MKLNKLIENTLKLTLKVLYELCAVLKEQ